MDHPELFEPDDPFVERMRAICLRFPEAVEVSAWGRPTFRAGKKVFALAGSGLARPYSLVFKPDPDEARAFHEDPRFFVPKYWGASGWLGIDIDPAAPDSVWKEVAELIETSYRQVALKRQLAVLDEVM
ncbi:MmcQ/YjbR family DNA-binding protein [Leifsonia sp. NPDC102414]|uniref:MmcQ/YjbR family DNA-binding protein n=1 Tax=Leifsonia sp. NPDC102414 TaxID=3364124 RepID=UPI0037F9F485